MSNVSKNEMQEIGNKTPFMEMMLKDAVGVEKNYDLDACFRIPAIEKAVKVRTGSERTLDSTNKFSFQFVIQQASDRYFQLISSAVDSMNSMFTESEMEVILNTNCSPFCQWSVDITVASMVADDLGIDQLSDLSDDSDVKALLKKLMRLSPIQNAALIDMCERFWRSAKAKSLKEVFGEMHFVFA